MSRYLNNATEELEFIDTAMNIFKKYEYKFLFGHIGDDKLKRKTIDVFNKHDEKLDELMELCFNSWPCNKPTTQAQSINDEQSLVQSQSSKQGYMNELIFKLPGFKPYSMFMTLLQFGIYSALAFIESLIKSRFSINRVFYTRYFPANLIRLVFFILNKIFVI